MEVYRDKEDILLPSVVQTRDGTACAVQEQKSNTRRRRDVELIS